MLIGCYIFDKLRNIVDICVSFKGTSIYSSTIKKHIIQK